MAQAKFFKKIDPSSPVLLANGQTIAFRTADYRNGYFSTDNPSLQSELVGFIEQGKFGLSEVSWDEFNDGWLKKKTNHPSRRVWREEISQSGIRSNPMQELHAEERNAVVVNGDRKPCPVAMAELPAEMQPKPSTPTTAAEFKANIGKREP